MRGLLLIAGVLVTGRPAWAKYDPCGHVSMLEPAGRVPRNARIWLWQGGHEQLRIRGPGVDRVIEPPFVGSRRGLAVLDPGLLGRSGRYRVVVVEGGHEWTLGELATGSEVDRSPPPPPRFRALAITQRLDPHERDERDERDGVDGSDGSDGSDDFDGFGDFGDVHAPASDIVTTLELSDDTLALDVAFDDSTAHFIVPREDPGRIGRDRCGPGRRFRVGAQICMSIRAIDLAGNRSDAATRCTMVSGQIGDTTRTARPQLWSARRHHRPADGPDGRLALTVFAVWTFLGLLARPGHAAPSTG